jgi:excisionase family DNA binding protein
MKPLWTLEEVCRFLSVKESYIYRLTSEDRIPYTKIGGQLRFNQEQIEKWLRQKARNHIRMLTVLPGGY